MRFDEFKRYFWWRLRLTLGRHVPRLSPPVQGDIDTSPPPIFPIQFDDIQEKWTTVPGHVAGERWDAPELLEWDTADIVELWETVQEKDIHQDWEARGWYHELYQDFLEEKRIMDVGSGFGIDGITFLQYGADVTFVDIAEENLELIRRVCEGLGVDDRARFQHIEGPDDIAPLPTDYDVVFAQGSLHNAPREMLEPEIAELLRHLRVGGRWLQLAYPPERWERMGKPPFSTWGTLTDGEGTPWCEPYDLEKLRELMAPATLDPVFVYQWRNDDFIWFDLKLRSRG